MTPEQCRMARAGLSISTRELADAAHVSVSTITRFEAGQSVPGMTVGLFQKALERQGVDFVSNDGNIGLWLKAPSLAAPISVAGSDADGRD